MEKLDYDPELLELSYKNLYGLKDRHKQLKEIRKDVYRIYNENAKKGGIYMTINYTYCYCLRCAQQYMAHSYKYHKLTKKHRTACEEEFHKIIPFINNANHELITEINYMIDLLKKFD